MYELNKDIVLVNGEPPSVATHRVHMQRVKDVVVLHHIISGVQMDRV